MSIEKLYEVAIMYDDCNGRYMGIVTDNVHHGRLLTDDKYTVHRCATEAALKLIEMVVDNKIEEIISDYQMLVEEATLGEDL